MKRSTLTAVVLAAFVAAAGCLRATPFDASVPEVDRDMNARNLQMLAARPPRGPALKLGFMSDTHSYYEQVDRIVAAMNARSDLDLVVIGGDLTDFGLKQEFEWALDRFEKIQVPWVTAIGNHDALSNGKIIFREMFGPYDFSFQYGGIKFVFFNSNGYEFPEANVPDLDWLDRELSDLGGASAAIVVTHHPPDSKEGIPPEKLPRYEQILSDRGVILNTHGHVSQFKVFREGNTAYLNVDRALTGQWIVFTVDGPHVTYEKCTYDVCDPPAELP
jgi:3',5'-cyclic-AMP phosphodiesterase